MESNEADSAAKEYRYSRLVHPRSIRILRLLHSVDRNAVVRCTLKIVDLGNPPDYIALSYTWRCSRPEEEHLEEEDLPDAPRDRWIVVNGARLGVTQNLHHCLLRLRCNTVETPGVWTHLWEKLSRKRTGLKRLWIDAICINQGDVGERSAQVGMMARIYRSASLVAIWLGQAENIAAAAVLEDLGTLGSAFLNHFEVLGAQTFASSTLSKAESLNRFGLSDWTSPRWRAVGYFFQNRWFRRLWVCQEVALASNAYILWGDADCVWWSIVLACRFLGASPLMELLVAEPFDREDLSQLMSLNRVLLAVAKALNLEMIRDDCWGTDRSGATTSIEVLEDLLSKMSQCEARDQRDTIFGLLGILERRCERLGVAKLPLRPDYHITVPQLYQQVTMLLISESKSLRFLSLAGTPTKRPTRSPFQRWPTWVADCSRIAQVDKLHLRVPKSIRKSCSFDASGKNPSSLEVEFEHTIMKLQSIRLATVSIPGQRLDVLREEFDFKSFARVTLGGSRIGINGQTHIEAFWRSCLLDTADGQHPAPAYFERSFAAWLLERLIDRLEKCVSNGWSLSDYLASMPSYKELEESDTKNIIPPLTTLVGIWHQLVEAPRQAGEKRSFDGAVPVDLSNLAQAFDRALEDSLGGQPERYLFTTEEGYIGLGPQCVRSDKILIVKGSDVPLAVGENYRMKAEDYRVPPISMEEALAWLSSPPSPPLTEFEYTLRGEAYVHGVMHGEAINSSEPDWETVYLS